MPKRRRTSRREFLKEGALGGGGLVGLSWLAPARDARAARKIAGAGGIRPLALGCEYGENPFGIDERQPRLSWILAPAEPGVRGQRQTAYQILAASSEDGLRSDEGDLWDSGKILSDQSTQIPYYGKPLGSRQQVWWKVRVWDRSGTVSPWSEMGRWSMGLLDRGDWQGKWIGLDGGEGKPEGLMRAHWIWSSESKSGPCYFRRRFTIPPGSSAVIDATVFVVAAGESTLYINGQKTATGQGTRFPISRDITELLKLGTNVISVSVTGSDSGRSGLIGVLQMELAGEELREIQTDRQWRVSSAGIGGWERLGFDDSGWMLATVLGDYGMAPWGEVGWAEHRVLPARMLRKEFRIREQPRRATVYISGLGLFEAYLNGRKLSADVLVPALSDYDRRVFYRTYDVTDGVKPGDNAIGVMLGNGRFFSPRLKAPTATRTFGYPKLLLQLEVEHSDGTVERIVSDETWKLTTEGPIRSNNVYDGEIYDARKEMEGWSNPGFHNSGWQQAKTVDAPAGALAAETIDPIRVMRVLKPVKITQPKPGCYIFDMGQNMVGWCRLTVAGPRGTRVSLRHAETLRPDRTLYLNNLRSARATDVYTLKGQSTEIYEPRFTYHGFRYVEVKGFPGQPSLNALEGCVVHDALPEHAQFTTSDPLINRIYENVLWGTRGNYRSIPTDCPQRDERQGWLGDRSAESRGETYLFDVARFYAKWMDDIADSQISSGSVSDVSPAYWPLYNDNVTWPASFFIVSAHLYSQYGDLRVIERHYDKMQSWIAHMCAYLKDDLMPRDTYGDWCVPPESLTEIHSKDPAMQTDATLLGTAYFYYLLRLMVRNAALLNRIQDSSNFDHLAARLKSAFSRRFFNPAGDYSNGSQTSSILSPGLRHRSRTGSDEGFGRLGAEHQGTK